MAIQVTRRHFTVDEYHRMGETGILGEDERVELIEGEIVDMAPIGVRHARCVDRLNMLLTGRVSQGGIVRVQSPIRLNEQNEPQPDITLLKLRDYSRDVNHPGPQDILIVVEVSETTLTYDRTEKLPPYARARIPEFWLVNLKDDRVEVYRDPSGDSYASVTQAGPGDKLAIPGFPGVEIAVAEML